MPLTTGQQTIVGLEAQDGATIAGLDDALYTQEFDLGLITITQDLADQSVVSASLTAYDAALTAQIDGTSPFTPITFSLINPVGGICYLRGTHIATPSGDVKIEDLKVGDPVLTLGQGVQPIKWIGRRRMDISSHPRPERAAPIRIRRDAFADSVPQRDLLVSPDHAIYVDGILVCARTLVNGATIVQQLGLGDVEYLHVELDQHAVLLAEGLGAELYLDTGNRGFFSNAGVPTVLHPDMSGETGQALRVAASCAPFVDDPDVIRPVWQALADRACALGAKRRALPTTNDPNLFLIADGQCCGQLASRPGCIRSACQPASHRCVWFPERPLLVQFVRGFRMIVRWASLFRASLCLTKRTGRSSRWITRCSPTAGGTRRLMERRHGAGPPVTRNCRSRRPVRHACSKSVCRSAAPTFSRRPWDRIGSPPDFLMAITAGCRVMIAS